VHPGQQGGPVGHYTVTGHLGDSSYSGDVVVDQIGNTYHVAWTIVGTTYAGIGISDGTNLAVGYRSGDAIGVAYYTPSNIRERQHCRNRNLDAEIEPRWTISHSVAGPDQPSLSVHRHLGLSLAVAEAA
jgi:hypothetical protein